MTAILLRQLYFLAPYLQISYNHSRQMTGTCLTVPTWLLCWTGTHFTKGLWAQKLENSFCFDLDSNGPIRSQICTCHASSAVVAYANLWPDTLMMIIFHIKAIYFLQDLNYKLVNPLWNGSSLDLSILLTGPLSALNICLLFYVLKV